MKKNQERVKRTLDALFAAAGLVVLALPMLAVAAFVRCRAGGLSAIYRQVRVGRGEKPFVLYKFRTMTQQTDARGCLLPDCDRLEHWGRVLRRCSLDELPQLFNILKGNMSFIGPRPLLPEYLALYTPEQRRRHAVRPGLSGLAVVSGRNALDWQQRLRLDVEYVDRWSLWLDLTILFKTLPVLLPWGRAVCGHEVSGALSCGSAAEIPKNAPH